MPGAKMKIEYPNAVFYGRVSTERQDTYEEQLAKVRKYCEETDGLRLDETAIHFYEQAITGEYFKHGTYLALLAYAREHPAIRYIVVYDISRWSRSGSERIAAERLRLRHEFGLSVISATEPHVNDNIGTQLLDEWGDPLKDPGAMGKAISRTAIDETNLQFRELIGMKSRAGVQAALQRGSPPGGRMPAFFLAIETGEYNLKGEPIRKVIPDPKTKQYHQAMFDLIAAGGSLKELSEWLASCNIISPGTTTRSGKVTGNPGKPFSVNTLRYNLMNYMYIGQYVYNRFAPRDSDNRSGRRFRSPEYWRIFENYCEPTVDPITFEKVHRILLNGRRPTIKYSALLTGKLYCGICGSKMTVVHNDYSTVYRCEGKKKRRTTCNATEISAEVLDGLLAEFLKKNYFSESYLASFLNQELAALKAENAGSRNRAQSELQVRYNEITQDITALENNTALSAETRSQATASLRIQLAGIQQALANKAQPPNQRSLSDNSKPEELSATLRNWWENANLRDKRALLRVGFQKLVFSRQGRKDVGRLEVYSWFPHSPSITASDPELNRPTGNGEGGI
jgi:DNA invertase Pin-like site-specific DNA recombinase